MNHDLNLIAQVRQLEKRLARIEATLLRLERLLVSQQAVQSSKESVALKLPQGTIRFVSPHLRRQEQATDFVMTITREP